MTSQNSKSPESIAQNICREWKTFWMNQKQNSEADYKNYLSRAMGVDANMRCHLEDMISAAIKTERENNRLVLPERRVMNFEWGYEHENSSVFGFNRCLDEIIRLNPDLVRSNEEKKI